MTKSVITSEDQTFTCTVGELDVGGTPVNVVWEAPDGTIVTVSDITNYDVSNGTVDGTGIQLAELTIKATKLADFANQSTFTYKCSVTSTQYPNSPVSTHGVVVNVLGDFIKNNVLQTF